MGTADLRGARFLLTRGRGDALRVRKRMADMKASHGAKMEDGTSLADFAR